MTAGVELLPLTPRQVDQRRAAGALIVDVRTDIQFDEAHIPGAVSITMLRQGFGTRLSWVADPEQEIVLAGRDDEDACVAGRLATAVGVRSARRLPRRRHDELARRAARSRSRRALDGRGARRGGRRPGARRPRAVRVARGPHPGFDPQAVPRPARAAERDRPGAARRGDLRLGPAQRDGRQPAVRTRRARGDPRGRRRRAALAAGSATRSKRGTDDGRREETGAGAAPRPCTRSSATCSSPGRMARSCARPKLPRYYDFNDVRVESDPGDERRELIAFADEALARARPPAHRLRGRGRSPSRCGAGFERAGLAERAARVDAPRGAAAGRPRTSASRRSPTTTCTSCGSPGTSRTSPALDPSEYLVQAAQGRRAARHPRVRGPRAGRSRSPTPSSTGSAGAAEVAQVFVRADRRGRRARHGDHAGGDRGGRRAPDAAVDRRRRRGPPEGALQAARLSARLDRGRAR